MKMTIFGKIKEIFLVYIEILMIRINGNPKIAPRNRHERRKLKHQKDQVI